MQSSIKLTSMVAAAVVSLLSFCTSAAVTKTKLGNLTKYDTVVTDVSGADSGAVSADELERATNTLDAVLRQDLQPKGDYITAVYTNGVQAMMSNGIVRLDISSAGGGSSVPVPTGVDTNAVIDISTRVLTAMHPHRIGPYIWEVDATYDDFTAATNRLATVYPSYRGGCSGVCTNRYHGRNLDWTYDKSATVIVRSPAKDGKLGVIGVSSGAVSDDTLAAGVWDDVYLSMPFNLCDGMNDHGVVIQENVITKDLSKSSVWHEKRDNSIIAFAVIRYALDRCTNALQAAELIRDVTFVPGEFPYDFHFLVSDRTSSYIVEDGHIYGDGDGVPTDIMTNFRVGTASYNDDGTVVWETVEPYGQGLERYDLARTNDFRRTVLDGMQHIMQSLWYTKTYELTTTPFWYTEHCDVSTTWATVMAAKTNQAIFAEQVDSWYRYYTNVHDTTSADYRNGVTWQTVHTAIYDKYEYILDLIVQENIAQHYLFNLTDASVPSISSQPKLLNLVTKNTRGVYMLSNDVEALSHTVETDSSRISTLEELTSSDREVTRSIMTRLPDQVPSAAYSVVDTVSPSLTFAVADGISVYVLGTDGIYHSLADVVNGQVIPYYNIARLYSKQFTTNYLYSLYGDSVAWTNMLAPTAVNIDKPISVVCGGIGYPKHIGSDATVRVLLYDMLYRDRSLYTSQVTVSTNADHYVSFSDFTNTITGIRKSIVDANIGISDLDYTYNNGPAFGTPLATSPQVITANNAFYNMPVSNVGNIILTNGVTYLTVRCDGSSLDSVHPKSETRRAVVRCYDTATLSISTPGTYVGRQYFTLTPGYHVVDISRIGYDQAVGTALYGAMVTRLNYQPVPPDFSSANTVLSETIDDAIADSSVGIITTAGNAGRVNNMRRISDYSYLLSDDSSTPDDLSTTITSVSVSPFIGGSGVVSNSLHGVNVDAYYTTNDIYVVRSLAKDGEHGFIGVTDPSILRRVKAKVTDAYSVIPFILSSGINDSGISVQQLPIPRIDGKSRAWRLTRSSGVHVALAVRHVLARCESAQAAAIMLRDIVYIPDNYSSDFHYLVSDGSVSYIVEDGVVYKKGLPSQSVLTNFRMNDRDAATAGTDRIEDINSLDDHDAGAERYNLIVDNYSNCSTLRGMASILNSVRYDKSYSMEYDDYWWTDRVNLSWPSFTVHDVATNNWESMTNYIARWHNDYTNEHDTASEYYRRGLTGYTALSVIYDSDGCVAHIIDGTGIRDIRLTPDDYDRSLIEAARTEAEDANATLFTPSDYLSVTSGVTKAATKAYVDKATPGAYSTVSNLAMSAVQQDTDVAFTSVSVGSNFSVGISGVVRASSFVDHTGDLRSAINAATPGGYATVSNKAMLARSVTDLNVYQNTSGYVLKSEFLPLYGVGNFGSSGNLYSIGWTTNGYLGLYDTLGNFYAIFNTNGTYAGGHMSLSYNGHNPDENDGIVYVQETGTPMPNGDTLMTTSAARSSFFAVTNGLASTAWVEGKGYVTASVTNGLVSASVTNGLASTDWVEDKGYVTASITNGLATTEYVDAHTPGNYAAVSNRAMRAYLDTDPVVLTNSVGSLTLGSYIGERVKSYEDESVGSTFYVNGLFTYGGDYYVARVQFQKTDSGWATDKVTGAVRPLGAGGKRSVTMGEFTSTYGSGSASAGNYCHAEGSYTLAEGSYTHAEGS